MIIGWVPAHGGRLAKEDAKTYWQYLGGCYLTWDACMMAEMAEAAGFSGDAESYLRRGAWSL